ncbi:hypothetical protein PLICRDRAFT_38403 [Plicaturopsis crispa FD-325 SS-3]|nr:hypothetical protein PLICRDRAFT_38403 [Plicaturopsis crispa FD-325 SS-3]
MRYMPQSINALSCTALLLAGVMQLVSAWLQYQTRNASPSAFAIKSFPEADSHHTWLGSDFPNALPLDLEHVALTLENSRHYPLDSPDADAEYRSLYPGDLGFLRLGPNKRFFGVAMYHQLHCLDSLRMAITRGPEHDHRRDAEFSGYGKRAQVPHVNHCLNYLRQTILCSADLTLEPEISPNEVGEGLAVTHVCRDWSRLYEYAEKNWEEYQEGLNKTAAGR